MTEWVQTCKYWSARRSRQPLQGGVSNVEYGWNRVTDSYHHDQPTSPEDDRASVKSGRSNLSRFNSATYGRKSFNATPGDRLWINDWKPPQPSLMPSPLDEEAQMDALTKYAKTLNEEFETHKKLEEPMMKLVRLRRSTRLILVLAQLEKRAESARQLGGQEQIPARRNAQILRIRQNPTRGVCLARKDAGGEEV